MSGPGRPGPARSGINDGPCKAKEGCTNPAEKTGLCGTHYQRVRKIGNEAGDRGYPLMPESLPGEEWRDVPGFPDYAVSDHERAWSKPRNGKPGVLLDPWLDDKGYLNLTLYRDGEVKKPYFHQVVAWAFLGECPEGEEVCHGPNGKLDNRPSNLSYGTHFKNVSPDKFRDGTFLTGEAHQNSKLTVAIVGECRRRNAAGEGAEDLAREFGVTQTTMSAAISGKTWRECAVPTVSGCRAGSRHRDAKLTEAIVLECRARKAAGETVKALSLEFGVSWPAMDNAIRGKTWQHVRAPGQG